MITENASGNHIRVVGLNLAPIIAKSQQEPTTGQMASKPRFDLTKKFNEMIVKKDVGQKAQAKLEKKNGNRSRQGNSSQKKGSRGSSRAGSRGKQMVKKNL